MPKSIEQLLINEELKLIREVNKGYKRFFKLVNTKVDALGGFEVLKSNKAKFKAFKADLPKLINKAGLNDLSLVIRPQLSKIEDISLRQLAEDLDKQLTPVSVRNARQTTLTGVDRQNLIVIADQKAVFTKKFTEKALDGITSKTGFNSLVKALTKSTRAKMQTIARTTVQIHDNLTLTNKANSLDLRKWKYAGADDSLNRPFCSDRVGKIFTDKEAESWDNGQIPNAKVSLGGYNCRHRKRYIVE